MSRLYLSCNHFKSCNNSYKICSLLHVWTRKYFGLHYLLLITASILVTFSHAYLCNVIWLQRFYQAVALIMSFITLFLQQKSSFLVSCTQGTRPAFVVCYHPHHRMAEVGQVLRKQFCPKWLPSNPDSNDFKPVFILPWDKEKWMSFFWCFFWKLCVERSWCRQGSLIVT